jgi:hypothetical protein
VYEKSMMGLAKIIRASLNQCEYVSVNLFE